MYATTHFMVGAVVGLAAGKVVPGFLLGLASHIILDIIPHYDYRTKFWGFLDMLVTLSIMYSLAHLPAFVLWGAIGGVLPDLEIVIKHVACGRLKTAFPTHNGILPHGSLRWPWGFYLQIVIVLIAAIVLLRAF